MEGRTEVRNDLSVHLAHGVAFEKDRQQGDEIIQNVSRDPNPMESLDMK